MDDHSLPIAQAAAGDQEAFAVIMRRMTPLIHSQISACRTDGTED